jgi:hypothetical protein
MESFYIRLSTAHSIRQVKQYFEQLFGGYIERVEGISTTYRGIPVAHFCIHLIQNSHLQRPKCIDEFIFHLKPCIYKELTELRFNE